MLGDVSPWRCRSKTSRACFVRSWRIIAISVTEPVLNRHNALRSRCWANSAYHFEPHLRYRYESEEAARGPEVQPSQKGSQEFGRRTGSDGIEGAAGFFMRNSDDEHAERRPQKGFGVSGIFVSFS
ncbi:hypothetical protein ACVIOG_006382 [Rhizobium leguminosarum]